MTKIYANLIGKWECLNDDPNCLMGNNKVSPIDWWKESSEIHSPFQKSKENTYEQLDYLWIHYNGRDYRINPIFVQVVVDRDDL